MARKLTRKEAKARTRQRLINGLLEVLKSDGLQGLTTTKVAEAAGVAQSSFYFHFEGMDDAMQAAARYLGGQIQQAIREQRHHFEDGRNPVEALRESNRGTLEAFLSEPVFAELFLTHRRDPQSPLGRTFRQLLDQSRQELIDDLRCMHPALPRPEIYGELFVGMTLAAVEAVIDGRITDKDACLEAMVHAVSAIMATPAPALG